MANLRDIRLRLLDELTGMTYDEAAALPTPTQVKLLNAVERGIIKTAKEPEDEDENEDENEEVDDDLEGEGADGGVES